MKGKLLLGVFLLTQFTILSVRSQNVPVLVGVQWLNENLSMPNLVILQVNALRLDYEKEHIAGARFLYGPAGWRLTLLRGLIMLPIRPKPRKFCKVLVFHLILM